MSVVIDCTSPVSDSIFKVEDLVEYLIKNFKVGGLRNNLKDKIVIESEDSKVKVTASEKQSKRAVRYYARKFLKKNDLRERFRIIASGKSSYEFRPYGVSTDE